MGAVREELDLTPLLRPLKRLGWAEADLKRFAVRVARLAYEDLRRGIREGKDINGRAFPRPLEGNKPLVRSGKLRRSTKAAVEGNKVVQTADTPYAEFVLRGTRRMAPRKYLGFGSRFRYEFAKLLEEFRKEVTPG